MSCEHDVNISSDGQQQRRHTAVIIPDRNRQLEEKKSDLRSVTGTQAGCTMEMINNGTKRTTSFSVLWIYYCQQEQNNSSASDRNVLSSVTSLTICKKPSIKVTIWQENGRWLDVNNIYSDMFYD